MIKLVLIMMVFSLIAVNAAAETPKGFLWYNLPKEPTLPTQGPKNPGTPFKQLSFTDQDAVLRFYTLEALHKARATHSMHDMKIFLSLQDYWLKESSIFSHLFQKTMRYYPEYDYTVTHPTAHLAVKVRDEERVIYQQQVLSQLARHHGILFFYRSLNPYDQKQIPIVRDFCARFHLSLIPISVDGQVSQALPSSRLDKGQANALGVRYFPALLLVNPTTQKMVPVAFGLTTQDSLIERLVAVATHFKGGPS